MRIDLHFHALGRGKDLARIDDQVYLNIDDDPSWLMRRFYHLLYDCFIERELVDQGGDTEGNDGEISSSEYLDLVYKHLVNANEIDGIVLLALDAVYGENGEVDERKTDLWVSNKYLKKQVDLLNNRLIDEGIDEKKFFLGASVNPNNKDWEEELEFVINETDAVLIKWIPSVQHIRFNHVPNTFYDRLAEAEMPLLSHVGPEYAFPEGCRQKYFDDFRLLETPLQKGVKVIAAHCNTPTIPLRDKNEIEEFRKFMVKWNMDSIRLYADTSALGSALKSFYLHRISRDFNQDWLVHGSDFPIPSDWWVNIPILKRDISISEFLKIIKCKNPLDRDVIIKRAYNFDDAIIHRSEVVLRMPP